MLKFSDLCVSICLGFRIKIYNLYNSDKYAQIKPSTNSAMLKFSGAQIQRCSNSQVISHPRIFLIFKFMIELQIRILCTYNSLI